MRALVAPAPFKGTLSAAEAARAMAAGLVQVQPDWTLDLAPISDGGDGFLETMIMATGARRQVAVVRGPVHSPVAAAYGLKREPDGVLALIESAQAAGLAHLPPEHFDPLGASSGGVGELMLEARQKGARRFLLGLGGSASTDGGAGLARALGYRLHDGAGDAAAGRGAA